MMEWFEIAQDGNAPRPQVARKNNGFLASIVLDEELDARRAKHVTGFNVRGGDTVGNRHRLPVRYGMHLPDDLLRVFHFVKRFAKRLALALKPAILAQDVLRLNCRRIA